jgi:hypothetical protein
MTFNDWLMVLANGVSNGLGVGAGVAIGTYFATKTIIRTYERAEKLVKRRSKNNRFRKKKSVSLK